MVGCIKLVIGTFYFATDLQFESHIHPVYVEWIEISWDDDDDCISFYTRKMNLKEFRPKIESRCVCDVGPSLVANRHSTHLASKKVNSSWILFWISLLFSITCCTSKSSARSRSHSASLNSRESVKPLGGRTRSPAPLSTSLSTLETTNERYFS